MAKRKSRNSTRRLRRFGASPNRAGNKQTAMLAQFNMGMKLSADGDLEGAADAFRRALALNPAQPETHYNLGNTLRDLGLLDEAVSAYQQAIELKPSYAKAHNSLGAIFTKQHRLRDAYECYRKALQIAPDYTNALYNIGCTLASLGKLEEAVTAYKQTVALEPGHASAHYNLGNLVRRLHGDAAAIPHYQQAVEQNPVHINAWQSLAAVHGRIDEIRSEFCFRKTLELDPRHIGGLIGLLSIRQQYCDFDAVEILHQRLVEALLSRVDNVDNWHILANIAYTHLFLPLPQDVYTTLTECLDKRLMATTTSLIALPPSGIPSDVEASRRLRVGFLSPNFRNHPVGQVTLSLFAHLDRERFEVHAFSFPGKRADRSIYAHQHRRNFDTFHDLGSRLPREAAQYIRSFGIDILIDLDGYMDNVSPDIMAFRAAPIQVFWLGHAGGLGLPFIDYLIADDVVVPHGEEHLYREKIVRLPDSYHCADRHPVSAEVPSRVACGLPEQGVVFCGFNNPEKIDRQIFACWMRILGAVPRSVLWLSKSRKQGQSELETNLQRNAEEAGISPDRLIFAERIQDKREHLARHAHCALLLDTMTLNASTTALDSLWAGLPVLTVRGERFANRISDSMLHAVGLSELICDNLEDYELRAISLAKDPVRLEQLKYKLANNLKQHPLYDIERFSEHLGDAFKTMWARHCAGKTPAAFDVCPRAPSPTRSETDTNCGNIAS